MLFVSLEPFNNKHNEDKYDDISSKPSRYSKKSYIEHGTKVLERIANRLRPDKDQSKTKQDKSGKYTESLFRARYQPAFRHGIFISFGASSDQL